MTQNTCHSQLRLMFFEKLAILSYEYYLNIIIPTFLLPNLSFQTSSLLHHSPNPLQLGCVPLLALY